jgi:hypothetical protein
MYRLWLRAKITVWPSGEIDAQRGRRGGAV